MFDIDGKLNLDLLAEYLQPQEHLNVLQLIKELTDSNKQLFIFTDSRYDEETEEFHYSVVIVDELHNILNQMKGKTTNNTLKEISDKQLAADLIAIHEAIDWLILNNHQYGAFIVQCDNKDILNAADEIFNYPLTSVEGKALVDLFKKIFLFRYILFVTSEFFSQQAPHIKANYLKMIASRNLTFEEKILPTHIKNTFYEVLEEKNHLENKLNYFINEFEQIKDIPELNKEVSLLRTMYDIASKDHFSCEVDLNLFEKYYGLQEKDF